jgi:hypothetical protein
LLWSGRRSRSSEIYVRASVDHVSEAELLHDRHGLARAAASRKKLWVERSSWGAREVGVSLAAIVLDEGNGHVRSACARNEALQPIKDDGSVMHRHRRLKLVHLRVNNEQHAARIAKWKPVL